MKTKMDKAMDGALLEITKELSKAVKTPYSGLVKMAKDEEMEAEPVLPGLEVAIHHQLAPIKISINIGNTDPRKAYHYQDDAAYKFVFHYLYLDLPFSIRTDDDKIAGKVCQFFNEEQRKQIMAIVLGGREEEIDAEEKCD